jgi:hypothetical protein
MKITKIDAYHIIKNHNDNYSFYKQSKYIRTDPMHWYRINGRHLNLEPDYEIEALEEEFKQTNNVIHEQLELI